MCTLSGDQITKEEYVKSMYDAGMRAVRINTAHLSGPEELASLAAEVKASGRDIKVLIDTKGPEMRTTATPNDTGIMLCEGDVLRIEGSDADKTTTGEHIVVNYPYLHTVLKPDDKLMIDDGTIQLIVEYVIGNDISARVLHGGKLGSRKGISIVGKEPDLPAVGTHDLQYILLAATSEDIDVIAHSFVRRAEDIIEVKKAMGACTKPVIAKIENQQGIDNLDEIAAVADALLIARGDLTATIGAEAVPEAQAKIAAAAVDKGLPLYLATRILPSMMDSPIPSGEDIFGIDLALDQGVDTMLLTNETATGLYPIACVNTLRKGIKRHESAITGGIS